MNVAITVATCTLLLEQAWCASTVEINGAGASFPFDVYSAWMPAYKAARRPFRHVTMKYDSIGSGGGKARIKGETGPPVSYAGSDSLLRADEYHDHPDLQMIPSIAGAVVMAFNIPDVSELHLSMPYIVAIYNGSLRYWNDSRLAALNTHVSLPPRRIQVAARRDKSGTTELFTAALSAEDTGWRDTYGTFSRGLSEDDTPYVWDSSVVTLYGETNRGVSGMVLSTKFSIGYLVLSDAITAKLPYAKIVNAAGKLVAATTKAVQNAMDDFAESFTSRMTRSLARPTGPLSYPLSGYTYIILHMTSTTDCMQATELVRYIEWFYTDSIARTECENLYMVPLSTTVMQQVMQKVVRKVQCRGQNVYDMVLYDKHQEYLSLQTWRTPVFVTSPIIGVLLILFSLYLAKDAIRTYVALLRNEWRIADHDISFSDSGSAPFGSRVSLFQARGKVHPSTSTIDSSGSVFPLGKEGGRVGVYRSQRVLFTSMPMLSEPGTLAMKRALVTLRDHVQHDNVTRFYGLFVDAEQAYCSVTNHCARGNLPHLLHGTRYKLDTNFKYSLCMGVARGLSYLHSQKLVHASLTSTCVYLDDHWTVRVGGWELYRVASMQKKSWFTADMMVTEWATPEFWTAPEVLSQKSLPTMAADVYSFAIIMQEIFSRDTPYSEQSAVLSPKDTLDKVVCESLRPMFTPDTPLEARRLMQNAWEMDPMARPSMDSLVKGLKHASPKTRSVMDNMLESLMQYATQLEHASNLGSKTAMESAAGPHQQKMTSLPLSVQRALKDADVTPQLLESVSVLVVCISDLHDLIQVSTPQEVVDFMTDVAQTVDTLLDSQYREVLRVHVNGDVYTLAGGVCRRSTDHLKVLATLALDLLAMESTFTIRHRPDDRLCLRQGLSSGRAVTGLVGHHTPLFAVLGGVLTAAQQLAQAALPHSTLLDQETHTALATFKHFVCVERKLAKDQSKEKETSYWLVGHRDMTQTFMP